MPDYLDLTLAQIDMYWDEWVTYVAFDRKFLPNAGGMRNQPDLLVRVFVTLDGLLEKIRQQIQEQKEQQKKAADDDFAAFFTKR